MTKERCPSSNEEDSARTDANTLNIPDWVPCLVRQSATAMWNDLLDPNGLITDPLNRLPAALLKRLVSDERMKRVWSERGELLRKSRDGSRFVTPARASEHRPITLEDQHFAMATFLQTIVAERGKSRTVVTEKEIEAKRRYLLRSVKQLHKMADSVFLFSPMSSKKLRDAAGTLQKITPEDIQWGLGASNPNLIVNRERSDSALRAFVILAVEKCRIFFGSPLYSTVATLTNVALDRQDMDDTRVRALVRGVTWSPSVGEAWPVRDDC